MYSKGNYDTLVYLKKIGPLGHLITVLIVFYFFFAVYLGQIFPLQSVAIFQNSSLIIILVIAHRPSIA